MDLQKYLATARVMIADPHSGSRAHLARSLIELGLPTRSLLLSDSFQAAEVALDSRPDLILSDFELGKHGAIDLLRLQAQKSSDDKNRIFGVVTANGSQAAVAQAAEEDVDVFLLKPFSMQTFRAALQQAVDDKFQPSEYLRLLEAGKTFLLSSETEKALECFETALQKHERPSLAYFYFGKAQLTARAVEQAQHAYEEGLKVNQYHHKCLVGLFEVLVTRHRYEEAYVVLKRLSRVFPSNPDRLAQILKLAILTRNYEDVEKYYELFTQVNLRSDDLVRHVCASLIVCGKYYLNEGESERGIKNLKNAAIAAGRRVLLLKEICQALWDHRQMEELEKILNRFPTEAYSSKEYEFFREIVENHKKNQ